MTMRARIQKLHSPTADFSADLSVALSSTIWGQGGAVGLDWKDMATTNATDGINRLVGSQFVSGFDDPTAIIKSSFRTFHPDQFVEVTAYVQSGYVVTNGTFHEAEMRLRSALSADVCTGYEVLIALNDQNASTDGYAVVRWDGGVGQFTTIFNGGAGSLGVPRILDGDIYRAEIRGNLIKVYRNGGLLGTHDITSISGAVYSGGQPGAGAYPQTPGCVVNGYGWRSFKAGDLA